MEILLFWIFLPTGLWKFCCSGYFCRLDCGNSVALDISASWGCGNFVALDISAGWIVEILLLWIFLPAGVVEILLLIKSFDRLGDLIYMVL